MKKLKYVIIAVCVVAAVVGAVFAVQHFSKPKTIAEKAIAYYEKQDEETYTDMKLEDFTDFDWDYVVVYRMTADAEEISSALGFEYEGDIDSTSGLVFVKRHFVKSDGTRLSDDLTEEELEAELEEDDGIYYDYEVVYEEKFVGELQAPYQFAIYPDTKMNSKKKARKFEKEQAVFDGERILYEGENRYAFFAQSK